MPRNRRKKKPVGFDRLLFDPTPGLQSEICEKETDQPVNRVVIRQEKLDHRISQQEQAQKQIGPPGKGVSPKFKQDDEKIQRDHHKMDRVGRFILQVEDTRTQEKQDDRPVEYLHAKHLI